MGNNCFIKVVTAVVFACDRLFDVTTSEARHLRAAYYNLLERGEDNHLTCIIGVWDRCLACWLGVAASLMAAASSVSTWKAAESLQLNVEGRHVCSGSWGAFPMDLHK